MKLPQLLIIAGIFVLFIGVGFWFQNKNAVGRAMQSEIDLYKGLQGNFGWVKVEPGLLSWNQDLIVDITSSGEVVYARFIVKNSLTGKQKEVLTKVPSIDGVAHIEISRDQLDVGFDAPAELRIENAITSQVYDFIIAAQGTGPRINTDIVGQAKTVLYIPSIPGTYQSIALIDFDASSGYVPNDLIPIGDAQNIGLHLGKTVSGQFKTLDVIKISNRYYVATDPSIVEIQLTVPVSITVSKNQVKLISATTMHADFLVSYQGILKDPVTKVSLEKNKAGLISIRLSEIIFDALPPEDIYAPSSISACGQSIDLPGAYIIATDLINPVSASCIEVSPGVSGVDIDVNGFSILCSGSGNGIVIGAQANGVNIHGTGNINNCAVGIDIRGPVADGLNAITGLLTLNNNGEGIKVGTNLNTITGVTVIGGSTAFEISGDNNLFVDVVADGAQEGIVFLGNSNAMQSSGILALNAVQNTQTGIRIAGNANVIKNTVFNNNALTSIEIGGNTFNNEMYHNIYALTAPAYAIRNNNDPSVDSTKFDLDFLNTLGQLSSQGNSWGPIFNTGVPQVPGVAISANTIIDAYTLDPVPNFALQGIDRSVDQFTIGYSGFPFIFGPGIDKAPITTLLIGTGQIIPSQSNPPPSLANPVQVFIGNSVSIHVADHLIARDEDPLTFMQGQTFSPSGTFSFDPVNGDLTFTATGLGVSQMSMIGTHTTPNPLTSEFGSGQALFVFEGVTAPSAPFLYATSDPGQNPLPATTSFQLNSLNTWPITIGALANGYPSISVAFTFDPTIITMIIPGASLSSSGGLTTLTVTGSESQVNQALALGTIAAASGFSGLSTIQAVAFAGSVSSAVTLSIDWILGVPYIINSASGQQIVSSPLTLVPNIDFPFTFTVANGGVGQNTLTITYDPTVFTITFDTTGTGAAFSTNPISLNLRQDTLTGTQVQINAALAALGSKYRVSGPVGTTTTLDIAVANVFGSSAVLLAVNLVSNLPPTIMAPATITATEDTDLLLAGVNAVFIVDDKNYGELSISFDSSIEQVAFSTIPAGISQSISPSGNSYTGAIADLNTMLASGMLVFVLNQNAPATVTLSFTDLDPSDPLTNIKNIPVIINPVNDPLQIVSAIQDTSMDEGTSITRLITVIDPDIATNNQVITPILVSTNSAVVNPSAGVQSPSPGGLTQVIVLTAPALQSITAVQTETITLTIPDGQYSDGATFDITVVPFNDPPSINPTPISVSILEDSSQTINVALSDPEDPVVFSATGDNPSLFSVTFSQTSNTAAQVQVFPLIDQSGVGNIQLSASDGINPLQTFTIPLIVTAVNDLPSLNTGNLPLTAMTNVDYTGSFTVTDPENTPSILVTTIPANLLNVLQNTVGTLTTVSLTSINPIALLTGQSFTISITTDDGSGSNTQSFVVTVSDAPLLNANAVDVALQEDSSSVAINLNQYVSVAGGPLSISLIDSPSVFLSESVSNGVLTFSAQNNFNTWNLPNQLVTVTYDNGLGSSSLQMRVRVDPIEDATVVASPPSAITGVEGQTVSIPLAAVFQDVDVSTQNVSFTYSVSNTNPSIQANIVGNNLEISTTTINSLQTDSISLTGDADGGPVLSTLPPPQPSPPEPALPPVLPPGTPPGFPASLQIPVTIQNNNAPPVISSPSSVSTAENSNVQFLGSTGVSVADPDSLPDSIEIQIDVTNGVATLASLNGLVFSVGDGVNDVAMVFQGTVTDINIAFDGMSFIPSQNYVGSGSMFLGINDLGHNGLGGPGVDSATIPIIVTANAPPQNNNGDGGSGSRGGRGGSRNLCPAFTCPGGLVVRAQRDAANNCRSPVCRVSLTQQPPIVASPVVNPSTGEGFTKGDEPISMPVLSESAQSLAVCMSPGGQDLLSKVERIDFNDIMPEGYVQIGDALNLDCQSGEPVEITMVVKSNYADMLGYLCQEGSCQPSDIAAQSSLDCGVSSVPRTVRLEEFPIVLAPFSVSPVFGDTVYQSDRASVKVVGQASVKPLAVSFTAPLNKDLRVIGAPIVVQETTKQALTAVQVPFVSEDIDVGTVALYAFVNGDWFAVGGEVNSVENIISVSQNLLVSTLPQSASFMFVPFARSCEGCQDPKLKLAYEPPGGVTQNVVLVHGLGSSRLAWENLVGEMRGTTPYRIYTFDYPANKDPQDSALSFAVELDKLSKLNPQPIVIVAHSFGGIIVRMAKDLINRNPAYNVNIEKVILVGTPNKGIPNELVQTISKATSPSQAGSPFNVNSRIIDALKDGYALTPWSNDPYFVIAGSKGYDFSELYFGGEPNDGVTSVRSAKTLGETVLNKECKNSVVIEQDHQGIIRERNAISALKQALIPSSQTNIPWYDQQIVTIKLACAPGKFILAGKKLDAPEDVTGCANVQVQNPFGLRTVIIGVVVLGILLAGVGSFGLYRQFSAKSQSLTIPSRGRTPPALAPLSNLVQSPPFNRPVFVQNRKYVAPAPQFSGPIDPLEKLRSSVNKHNTNNVLSSRLKDMQYAALNIGIERQKRIQEGIESKERVVRPIRDLQSDELTRLREMVDDIDNRLRALPPPHIKHHGSNTIDPAVLGHLVMPRKTLSPEYEMEQRLNSINARLARLEDEIDNGLSHHASKETLGKILREIDKINYDIGKK